MFLNCCNIPQDPSFYKEIAPYISSFVVILIFAFDRLLGYRLRKKELERTWYYKVLLEPNLEKIDSFFKDTLSNIKDSYKTLQSINFEENRSHYIKVQLLELEIYKKTKREFELDVLQPIYSKYNVVNSDIQLTIEKIFDEYSKIIGESILKNFNEGNFMDFLYLNKVELLEYLYKPLK